MLGARPHASDKGANVFGIRNNEGVINFLHKSPSQCIPPLV